MAIAVTVGVTSSDTSNTTSYPTGSFTPSSGDMLVAFVMAGATAAAGTMTDSLGLGTWNRVAGLAVAGSGDRLYCFVCSNLSAGSAMTVTFDCTGDAADGAAIYVARLTGFEGGRGYYRQVATNTGGLGGTPSVVMATAFNTNNCGLAALGNALNPPAATQPTGWTVTNGYSGGYSTPDTGLECSNRVSGETASTITWGAISATGWAAIILEIYAAGQGPVMLDDLGESGFFGVQAAA